VTRATVSTYHAERSRIEVRAGDELVAWVDLRPGGASTIIAHTEVLEGHDGQGLGRVAVRAAVEHIHGDGKSIIAICPFARAVLARDPALARTGRMTAR
jgi:predicted GNAT family acetyltransferase